MKSILLLVAVIYTATNEATSPQSDEKLTQLSNNPCISKTTCGECIQSPTCAWCSDPNFGKFGDKQRCFQITSNSSACSEEFTWYPDNEIRFLVNKELSKPHSVSGGSTSSNSSSYFSWSSSSSSEIVQVAPQHINLKLKKNEAVQFKMAYAQTKDYPIDLYFLMDLSKSMEDDKENLSHLGDLLVDTMRNISSDFRIGFGSFVEKVVMPYVSTIPKNLKTPCMGCAAPYGFRNHMSLSQNTNEFSQMVKTAAISGSGDQPEGGFDAIMQALVCRNEIGWRENARRILVVATDAGFHYAGDGKLGGIITPNDGYCHLDSNGYYTYSSLQDYPSISQINAKVIENAINIIFAVTPREISTYRELQRHIEGSSIGTLSADSSNIVELIKHHYEQISSSIQIKDTSSSEMTVDYYSSCLNPHEKPIKTNRCENIKVGDVVQFTVEIKATACPKNPKEWKQTIQLYPVGINESLTVDLEILCSCSCENPGHYTYSENAAKCNNNGVYKCGICECNPNHFGKRCECSTYGDEINDCRHDNTTSVVCSGRGQCICGQCECEVTETATYSGKYCEKCPTCYNRCWEFKECVQCQMYKTGSLSEKDCAEYCTFVPIVVRKAEADKEKNEISCAYYDEDDCRFAYVYYYDENNKVAIKAQEERECPPKIKTEREETISVPEEPINNFQDTNISNELNNKKDKISGTLEELVTETKETNKLLRELIEVIRNKQ